MASLSMPLTRTHTHERERERVMRRGMRPETFLFLFLPLCCFFFVHAEEEQFFKDASGLILHFYKMNHSCDYAEVYVKHMVNKTWVTDASVTPALLRLLYSDCFVTGCDASILLDGPKSEKMAPQNSGLRAFDLIDRIKRVLEARCPGVVSCADILNLATRDAAALSGAPAYPVFTGRRDSTAISSMASVRLPRPSITWQEALKYFKSKGLDVLDLTTLLGAHTVGSAHCKYINDRLYNFNGTRKPDPNMNSALVADLRRGCKQSRGTDPTVFLNPDSGNTFKFTNSYYARILKNRAILGIDQQLSLGPDTNEITQEFAEGFEDFRQAFALSMSKMGLIGILTGTQGEIRRNCRFRNVDNPRLKPTYT